MSRTLPCNEPCLFSTAVCLQPPAAAACYTCCRRLLCENQAQGLSGLETILGRVLQDGNGKDLISLVQVRSFGFFVLFFVDGYCSTVQGLLDWFEVDLGFT